MRIGAMSDSSLIARRLAAARHVLCAAPSFLARHGRPEAPADLAHLPHVRYAIPEVRSSVRFADGSEVGVDGPLISNNGDVLVEAAANGVGIAALPSFIAHSHLRDGRLECLLAAHPLAGSVISAVYPHRRHLSPKVRVFIDFLIQRFAPEPYWDAGLFE